MFLVAPWERGIPRKSGMPAARFPTIRPPTRTPPKLYQPGVYHISPMCRTQETYLAFPNMSILSTPFSTWVAPTSTGCRRPAGVFPASSHPQSFSPPHTHTHFTAATTKSGTLDGTCLSSPQPHPTRRAPGF